MTDWWEWEVWGAVLLQADWHQRCQLTLAGCAAGRGGSLWYPAAANGAPAQSTRAGSANGRWSVATVMAGSTEKGLGFRRSLSLLLKKMPLLHRQRYVYKYIYYIYIYIHIPPFEACFPKRYAWVPSSWYTPGW